MQDEIEVAVNRFGVGVVLEMVAEVCNRKALQHSESVLSDKKAEKRWATMADRIEKCAELIYEV